MTATAATRTVATVLDVVADKLGVVSDLPPVSVTITSRSVHIQVDTAAAGGEPDPDLRRYAVDVLCALWGLEPGVTSIGHYAAYGEVHGLHISVFTALTEASQ